MKGNDIDSQKPQQNRVENTLDLFIAVICLYLNTTDFSLLWKLYILKDHTSDSDTGAVLLSE